MKARVPFSLTLLAAVVLLAGCNLFFVAREGRWNPSDPDNELVRGSSTLTPALDGFVHGADMGTYFVTHSRVFGETELQLDYYHDGVNGGYCYTLLRFDLNALPEVALLEQATLTLTFAFVGPNADPIDCQRIAVPWDYRSVETEETELPSFVTGALVSTMMPASPVPVSVDVTELVRDWLDGSPNYGLRLRAWTGGAYGYQVTVYASEAGAQGPRLELTYRAIPH
jgi:hypothetical protein